MDNRLYTYISTSKVDMLYYQNVSVVSRETSGEIDAGVSGKIASISGKISTKEKTELNKYSKLVFVEKLLKDKNLVGGLFDDRPFIEGQLPLYCLSGRDGMITWTCSYHDIEKRIFYNFLFYGSANNLISEKRKGPLSWALCSDHPLAIQNIILSSKMDSDGVTILNNASAKIDKLESYRRKKINEKWEVIEYIRSLYGSQIDDLSHSFLIRIDYRETVSISKYLQSPFAIGVNFKNRNATASKIPEEVDYIVYVFGSPIYVEQVPLKGRIHIIDGNKYLYLPEKEFYDFSDKKGYAQEKAVELLRNMLWDCGLVQESVLFKNEYWGRVQANSWNSLDKSDFEKLIREYITTLPPL